MQHSQAPGSLPVICTFSLPHPPSVLSPGSLLFLNPQHCPYRSLPRPSKPLCNTQNVYIGKHSPISKIIFYPDNPSYKDHHSPSEMSAICCNCCFQLNVTKSQRTMWENSSFPLLYPGCQQLLGINKSSLAMRPQCSFLSLGH